MSWSTCQPCSYCSEFSYTLLICTEHRWKCSNRGQVPSPFVPKINHSSNLTKNTCFTIFSVATIYHLNLKPLTFSDFSWINDDFRRLVSVCPRWISKILFPISLFRVKICKVVTPCHPSISWQTINNCKKCDTFTQVTEG